MQDDCQLLGYNSIDGCRSSVLPSSVVSSYGFGKPNPWKVGHDATMIPRKTTVSY